jgi:TatD DNase family protein
MKTKIFDTHCHLNLLGSKEENYESRKKEIIISKIIDACKNNVGFIQNIAVNLEEFEEFYPIIFDEENGVLSIIKNQNYNEQGFSEETIENLKNFEIYTSLGLHPLYPNHKFDPEKAFSLASRKFVNSIGECGLDYHLEPNVTERREQQKNFLLQIDLAAKKDLPLIIHTRNAESQTHHYLFHAFNQRKIRGIMHCFTGSKELAFKMIDIGFFISFPGIITFKKKVDHLIEIVKEIPLEKILIETDSPYLAPEPYRGKENGPAYVKYVGKKIAEIKNLDEEEVFFQITQNSKSLFIKK